VGRKKVRTGGRAIDVGKKKHSFPGRRGRGGAYKMKKREGGTFSYLSRDRILSQSEKKGNEGTNPRQKRNMETTKKRDFTEGKKDDFLPVKKLVRGGKTVAKASKRCRRWGRGKRSRGKGGKRAIQ